MNHNYSETTNSLLTLSFSEKSVWLNFVVIFLTEESLFYLFVSPEEISSLHRCFQCTQQTWIIHAVFKSYSGCLHLRWNNFQPRLVPTEHLSFTHHSFLNQVFHVYHRDETILVNRNCYNYRILMKNVSTT